MPVNENIALLLTIGRNHFVAFDITWPGGRRRARAGAEQRDVVGLFKIPGSGNLPASDHGTDSLAGDTRVSVMFRVTRLTRLVVTGSVTVTGPSERVTNLAESLAF